MQKDPEQKWTTLPFITIDDVVFVVLDTWPLEWHAPDLVVCNETENQRQKVFGKLLAPQKQNEQLAEEVWASREAAKTAVEKTAVVGIATTQEERGPNLTIGHGENDTTEGADPSTTSTQLK